MRIHGKLLFVFCLVLLGFASTSHAGGRYIGKARPYYWSGSLYIAPVDSQKSSVPDCATRHLLRLKETDPASPVFNNKFAILLAAWMAGRDVDLRGTGECTSEGDEIIYVVIPL